MSSGYKVAVVGATGNVGREMLKILSDRKFPVREIVALASARSAGKEVSFGDVKTVVIQDLAKYDFRGTDIALFSPGGKVSAEYAPKAAAAGCIVIDNTSHFRMDPEVPLVVPEVNPEAISEYTKKYIIANPNCSTIQMVVALKPLHDAAKIKRVVVSTYQSVSGAGKEAMDELYNHTKSIYMNDIKAPEKFSKRISFNVIPQIDVFTDSGDTKEEIKMVNETKKIMGSDIPVSATCVRVPVFTGHSESVNIEFENPITPEEARKILSKAPGVVVSAGSDFVTPIEVAGQDEVFVSRIRKDPTVKNGLNLWCVSDNLRKGAALNAVQIAETIIANYNLASSTKEAAVN